MTLTRPWCCSMISFTSVSPVTIDGHEYVDGGIGSSHGICLEAARHDGFKRFFMVLTRERGFRMEPSSFLSTEKYRIAYAKHPAVYEAIERRPVAYNALLDEISELEAAGDAYVFYPDEMPVSFVTTDHAQLCHAYELGTQQCAREFPAWMAWLNKVR